AMVYGIRSLASQSSDGACLWPNEIHSSLGLAGAVSHSPRGANGVLKMIHSLSRLQTMFAKLSWTPSAIVTVPSGHRMTPSRRGCGSYLPASPDAIARIAARFSTCVVERE